MNFGELKQEVANYMHRTDLDTFIPGFIEKARQRINRDLRVREMIVQTDVTPVVNPFPAPDGFLEMRDIYHLRGNNRVTLTMTNRRKLNTFINSLVSDSVPLYYSIDGTQIETRPGGIAIDFTLLYWTEQLAFVDDADERSTLDRFETIWLYASLIEGHTFAQDLDLATAAQNFYTSEVTQANSQAAMAESGAALEMQGAAAL